MTRSPIRGWLTVAAALVAVLATSTVGAIPAAATSPVRATTPGDCPRAIAVSAVRAGQTATGWTVATGKVPQPFNARILGVLNDGIAPGRDMVLVKVSDVPGSRMMRRARGIWAGMSGSPVYVGDRLLGAVSYGLTEGPSFVGGVTPATDMLAIFRYPAGGSSAHRGATPRRVTAPRVVVPRALRPTVAAAAGVSLDHAASLSQLKLPLVTSGLDAKGRQRLQRRLDQAGYDVLVTSGQSVPAPTSARGPRPVPGGNFAAMLSFGDVAAGAVGTTTYVCGDRALAFGHPMTFGGAVSFGANASRALMVVRDPRSGPHKLASIGGGFGTVVQDRMSGIAASLGRLPAGVPIVSTLRAPDTHRSRTGRSWAIAPGWVTDVTWSHVYSNIATTLDRSGSGSAQARWVVEGRRANGKRSGSSATTTSPRDGGSSTRCPKISTPRSAASNGTRSSR